MTLLPDMEVWKSSFLGTVGITFFGTWELFKKDFMDCFILPDG